MSASSVLFFLGSRFIIWHRAPMAKSSGPSTSSCSGDVASTHHSSHDSSFATPSGVPAVLVHSSYPPLVRAGGPGASRIMSRNIAATPGGAPSIIEAATSGGIEDII